MTAERKEELNAKRVFVKSVGRALWDTKKTTVVCADYEVYEGRYEETYEFLVVNYVGGAMSVRTCTGTSISGIFEEFAKLVPHGYYDELGFYKNIKDNSKRVIF